MNTTTKVCICPNCDKALHTWDENGKESDENSN